MDRETYLLTWNPLKFDWRDFQVEWQDFHEGEQLILRWSCGQRKHMNKGDRVFLMRLGHRQPIHGILLSGVVTELPYEAPHWDEDSDESVARYCDFEVDAFLNPAYEALLDPYQVSPDHNWTPQTSGTIIPATITADLETAWLEHLQSYGFDADISDETVVAARSTGKTYREGRKRRVSTIRYERNGQARAECIETYGYECAVCELDLVDLYGEIAEGYVEVHHLKPISAQEGEREVDPVKDLRPVCPNCHTMLHQNIPPYSIEELRETIKVTWGEIWSRLDAHD